ncbi:MAG: GNAT family N-acetyltransferase [Vicinamibacteria bacterium]
MLETERLALSKLSALDAGFIVELLNEPAFLRYIGDRGVRDAADALRYLEAGPAASYARFGFGLYRVGLKPGGDPIGICGLLKRDALPDPDIGFAILQRYRSRGFAHEAAAAVLAHGREALGLRRVLAITSRDNDVSIGLLVKLGFRFERLARLAPDTPEVKVFAVEL